MMKKSFWQRHKFLLLRRFSQAGILGLFLTGPYLGIWLLRGNYSASNFFGIPFTDPLITAQSLATGYLPSQMALLGAGILVLVYALLGSRIFCAWVCPLNVVTDFSAFLRRKLGIRQTAKLSRHIRYVLLVGILIASAITGTLVWEALNPVSALGRNLIYGASASLWLVVAIFFFDLFVVEHGWCGHLCPLGAAYGVIGAKGIIRIGVKRENCTDCMQCYAVCPEPIVLRAPLHGKKGEPAIVLSQDCITCGRCMDVCDDKVFYFKHRFHSIHRGE